ncbi:MAG: vitamin K epoxide reductase family protein [Patescibacteria group bacterium]
MKQPSSAVRIVIGILALIGIGVMGYLVSLHFSSDTGGSFCNLGEGLSCDIVNKSLYSKIFGIPMSALGLLYFIGAFGVVVFAFTQKNLKFLAFLSIVFLGPSLYLTGIEIFVLENICIFCELSKVLIISIIITAFIGMGSEKLSGKDVIFAIILAAVLGGATYIIHDRTVPTDKYNELAQCLSDKGFIVYGSITCQYCARQRSMFGDAFQYIKEIECNPRNEGYVEGICEPKNIEGTPTWMQEDSAGKTLYRFDTGVQELERLAEVSGCPLPQ